MQIVSRTNLLLLLLACLVHLCTGSLGFSQEIHASRNASVFPLSSVENRFAQEPPGLYFMSIMAGPAGDQEGGSDWYQPTPTVLVSEADHQDPADANVRSRINSPSKNRPKSTAEMNGERTWNSAGGNVTTISLERDDTSNQLRENEGKESVDAKAKSSGNVTFAASPPPAPVSKPATLAPSAHDPATLRSPSPTKPPVGTSQQTPQIGKSSNPVIASVPSAATTVTPDSSSEKPSAEPQPEAGGINAGIVQARLQQAEAVEMPPEVKTQVQSHFQKAGELLKRAEDIQTKIASFQKQISEAPALGESLKKELALPVPEVQVAETLSPDELNQQLAAETALLNELKKELEKIEASAKERTSRKTTIVASLEELKKNLASTKESIAKAGASGESPALVLARKTEHEALAQLLQRQIDLSPVEQSFYTAMADVFVLQKDLAQRRKKFQQTKVDRLETALAQAEQLELKRQAAEARKAVQEAHPALRSLAQRNAELTEQRSEYLAQIRANEAELDRIKKIHSQIEAKFQGAKEKEERTGLTTSIGLLLRNEKHHLPSAGEFDRHQQAAESEIVKLHEELIALEEERDSLGDLDAKTATVVQEIVKSGQPVPNDIDLEAMTLEMLTMRRQFLTDLVHDIEKRLETQVELATLEKSLSTQITEFRGYIDERILWIRSANVVSLATVKDTGRGLLDLFSADRWSKIGQHLLAIGVKYPVSSAGLGFVFLLLIAMQGVFVRRIAALGEADEDFGRPKMSATFWAFLLTGFVSAVWPFLMWLVGRQVVLDTNSQDFAVSLGRALQVTAVVFGSVELFRQICRPNGIAEKHLNWPEKAVRGIHANLVGLLAIGLPLVFALELSNHWQDGRWSDSVGRVAFISAMLWFAWSLHRLLTPRGIVFREFSTWDGSTSPKRFLKFGYLAAALSPLFLAGLAITGYQYTAEQLFIRLELTLWLAIGLTVAYSLMTASAFQAHSTFSGLKEHLRSTVHAEVRPKSLDSTQRNSASIPAESSKAGGQAGELEEAVGDEVVNVEKLQSQIRKFANVFGAVLFLAGSWWIWGEVLPALHRFNAIELWWTTVQVAQSVDGETGTELVPTTKSIPITLGHLLVSIGLIVLTTVAAGNLPGLMELVLLKRLPLDSGAKNAATTLTRYVVAVVGVVLAAKMIGIGWSSVQWLVAALTVGLGFGLQEIFANFVSGLIILFERPVRIGDVVTIDGVTGTISRIQIRATTIRDFDKKEYLVPNKEFVTGRLMNWTLTDRVNRVLINVGIAYGSDPDVAREKMLLVAKNHPKVLDDPAPIASFEGFGDSSLDLVLRCFLPDLDDRLNVITELHTGINREFSKVGIEIPFPQMDLHVKDGVGEPAEPEAKDTTGDEQMRRAA